MLPISLYGFPISNSINTFKKKGSLDWIRCAAAHIYMQVYFGYLYVTKPQRATS